LASHGAKCIESALAFAGLEGIANQDGVGVIAGRLVGDDLREHLVGGRAVALCRGERRRSLSGGSTALEPSSIARLVLLGRFGGVLRVEQRQTADLRGQRGIAIAFGGSGEILGS
jgi:hypothetical protein